MDRVSGQAVRTVRHTLAASRLWGGRPAGFMFGLWGLYGALLAWLLPIGPVTPADLAQASARHNPSEAALALRAPLVAWLAQSARVLPLADAAARTHLVALLLGLAVFALVPRRVERGVAGLLPVRQARASTRDTLQACVATLGGVSTVALSPIVVTALVTVPAAALTALAFVGVMSALRGQSERPFSSQSGLLAAFLAGLCAGVAPVLVAIVLPVGGVLWWRALRAGARWPVLAPFLFSCGTLVLLSTARREGLPAWWPWTRLAEIFTLADLRSAVSGLDGAAVRFALLHLVESLGIVAALLSFVGLVIIAVRTPTLAVLHVFGMCVAVLSWAHALHEVVRMPGAQEGVMAMFLGESEVPLPWVVAVTLRAEPAPALVFLLLCATPIAAAILGFSSALGRARVAAALAVGVIAAAGPLLSLVRIPPHLAVVAAPVGTELPWARPRAADAPRAQSEARVGKVARARFAGKTDQGKIPRSR